MSILLLAFGTIAKAEKKDSIVDRNITVEREYKPLIQDAGKINTSPKMIEPSVQKATPRYSDFNLPLNADFNIHTLPSAELQLEKRRISKGGFARLGLGNYLNTLADFAYPLIKKTDTRLDFSLNHLGTFGGKTHSTTNAALAFDKYFKTFNLYTGLNAGHEYFKYYGNGFNANGRALKMDTLAAKYPGTSLGYSEKHREGLDPLLRLKSLNNLANDSTLQTFWRVNAYAGIRSLPLTKGVQYNAEIQYKSFSAHNGIKENHFRTLAQINMDYNDNRVGLDIELNNITYSTKQADFLNFYDAYAVYTLNPYYKIETDDYNVRLGVRSSFTFVPGSVAVHPSLDVNAEWKVAPEHLSLYGGITGEQAVNTQNKIFDENRFLSPDIRVKDTSTPIDFFAGIKLKPIYNLLFDAYVDYSAIDNQYFFFNKEYDFSGFNSSTIASQYATLYSNKFDVLYSKATHLKVGMRANYNIRRVVNVELKGAYNGWHVNSEQYAWNKPKWEANLNTDVYLTHDLSISANLFYEGERYAKLGTMAMRMRPKVDINLGASYSTNSWFTAFVKINNLINNPYEMYYGYQVQGINALVGVAFSF